MTESKFLTEFDSAISNFRDGVAKAHGTMMDAGKRYVVMLEALDFAFSVTYADLPETDQVAMHAAFFKLARTVAMVTSVDDNENDGLRVVE